MGHRHDRRRADRHERRQYRKEMKGHRRHDARTQRRRESSRSFSSQSSCSLSDSILSHSFCRAPERIATAPPPPPYFPPTAVPVTPVATAPPLFTSAPAAPPAPPAVETAAISLEGVSGAIAYPASHGDEDFKVVLDHPAAANSAAPFVAGSIISGRLQAHLPYDMVMQGIASPTCNFTIQLIGKEFTGIPQKASPTKGVDVGRSSQPLVQAVLLENEPIQVVQVVDSGLGHGHGRGGYKVEVPFQAPLPANLPSSSISYSSAYAHFSIEYSLQVFLDACHGIGGRRSERSYYSKTIPIRIRAATMCRHYQVSLHNNNDTSTSLSLPFYGEPVTSKDTGWTVGGLCKPGQEILLGAWMESTILEKGSLAKVSLSCRFAYSSVFSSMGFKNKEIRADLVELCQWNAEGTYDRLRTVLHSVNFGNDVMTEEKIQSRDGSASKLRTSMLHELRDGTHIKKIKVPLKARISYTGQLIKVRHELRVWVHDTSLAKGLVNSVKSPSLMIVIPVTICEASTSPTNNTNTNTTLSSTPTTPVLLTATAPLEVGIQGMTVDAGVAVATEECYKQRGEEMEQEVYVYPATAAPALSVQLLSPPPSLKNLHAEIKSSLMNGDGEDEILERLFLTNDPAWASFYANLKPKEFGEVIKNVSQERLQLRVAEAMAQTMIQNKSLTSSSFVCEHVRAAVLNGTNLNRITMVERLIRYATDVAANGNDVVRSVLTEWEKEVTADAFERALVH